MRKDCSEQFFGAPNPKDGIEHKLHQRVCAGNVPLAAAAEEAIANDWTTANNDPNAREGRR
jgi:hypothetical protein